jgi:metal binding Ada-like protein
MAYRLLQPDGSTVLSEVPGTLGGNATLRIYGRLDCESAVNALRRGYAKHRVFFADEQAAIDAGFRPCGRCMHESHAIWKAGPGSATDYPWHITPRHPVQPE